MKEQKRLRIKILNNSGPKSSFTTEHNEYIKGLLDNGPQLYSDDIINSLTERFEDLLLYQTGFHINMRNSWARSKSG
ncbi:hypothetical protein BCV72DRAFT_314494, partial [Rhizopus microsporus var. microsporus]